MQIVDKLGRQSTAEAGAIICLRPQAQCAWRHLNTEMEIARCLEIAENRPAGDAGDGILSGGENDSLCEMCTFFSRRARYLLGWLTEPTETT